MVWWLQRPLEPSEPRDDAYTVFVNEKRNNLLKCDTDAFHRVVKNEDREHHKMCKIIRSLYGKYKWTRLRVIWLLRAQCIVMYRHLHQELRLRPGNAGALEASASFWAAAKRQKGNGGFV